MNFRSQAPEKNLDAKSSPDARSASAGLSSWARWLTISSDRPVANSNGFSCQLVAGGNRQGRYLSCLYEADSLPPSWASRNGSAVIIGGTLYNEDELAEQLKDSQIPFEGNVAELVLTAYLRWGKDVLRRLRGTFALVIWDSNNLLAVRDPLGSHPLFFAETPTQVLVSPAIDLLTLQPQVSRELNRIAMADLLMQRPLAWQDTFFEAVHRVPAGHAISFLPNDVRVHRYWDPAPGGEVDWVKGDEMEQFEHAFDRAVERCLSFGPTGVFLSGGLDSVSVAATAVDLCSKARRAEPLALSLVFPHPETNEEEIQTNVAKQLGLPQVIKPFFEATGENGLFRPALAMNRNLPAPLLNPWLPAYKGLALEGTRRGCEAIVTGGGGDEWLGLGPFLAADLMRELDLRGLYRLWKGMRLSYTISGFALARSVLWKYGALPHLLPPTHKLVKRFAPWALRLRHRASRPNWVPPKWVAPDPSLRRQLLERAEQRNHENKPRAASFYVQGGKESLDHPMLSWEQEEMFEVYKSVGVRVLQPFWDVDLVDLLFRMPPFALNRGGKSKGLVRDSLARRFPDLGFGRQRKVLGLEFYRSLVERDAAGIWQELDGAKALQNLGVVDQAELDRMLNPILKRPPTPKAANEVWTVLNLESWTRTQVA